MSDSANIDPQETIDEIDDISALREVTFEAREIFYRAEEATFASREDEGLALYNKVIRLTSDSLYGRISAGQIAALSSSYSMALNEFLQAQDHQQQLISLGILQQPEDRVQIHVGLTYRKLRMYEEAVETFESINPPDREDKCAFAFAGIASVYRQLSTDKTLEEAESARYLSLAKDAAETALAIDPEITYAKSTLVRIYEAEGQSDPATMELAFAMAQEVVAKEPENWYMLGTLASMVRKTDNERALEYYRQSVMFAPRREYYPRYGLAMLLRVMDQNNIEEPKALFEEVLAVNPDHNGALSQLANIYWLLKDFDKARSYAERAIELSADDSLRYQLGARVTLARIEMELGHFALAADLVRPYKRVDEDWAKRDSKLRSVLKKLSEQAGKLPEYQAQAEKAFRSKKLKDAYDLYLQIVDLDPRNFRAYGQAAICCLEARKWGEAIKVAESALEHGESMGFSERYLAGAYANTGRIEEAAVTYRLALEKNADRKTFRSDDVLFIQSEIRRLEGILKRKTGGKKFSLGNGRKLSAKGPYFEFRNNTNGQTEVHSASLIEQFLPYVLETQKLPIGKGNPAPIDQIGDDPTFLVAKTGVGKTVTVPTKVFIRHFQRYFAKKGIGEDQKLTKFPQVYVVVPRIPIAQSQMNFMNYVYQSYLKSVGIKSTSGYNLFGSVSSAGKKNADAPILFVTTGIFESMAFNDQLDPDLHRVIIDEAHVTIEQNSGVEIGIAIAKQRGVVIDYMSATVKTDTLADDLGVKIAVADNVRYPILMRNLGGPVEDNLLDIIENYLVNPKEELYPDRNDPDYGQITKDLFDNRDRARGLLVIVNSHQGSNSDTRRFCQMIERAPFNQPKQKVSVFSYAAPIARDKALEDQFRRQIESVEKKKGLYVIVATNVVEMGVTFDSLDYIITMDSEFITTFVDGGQLLETTQLGVNALYQRIGRVGRKRGGIAFIAMDFGADYAKLPDSELRKGLPCQEIQFPIAKGNLAKLALWSYKEAWSDPHRQLHSLGLPSMRREKGGIIDNFDRARAKIEKLGLVSGPTFNDIGKRGLEFLSVESLDYKRLLALAEKRHQIDLLKVVLVAAACADLNLGNFLQSGTRFTAKDDMGTKDHLTLDKFLLLDGENLSSESIQGAISGLREDALKAKLVEVGVSAEDAFLIDRYLADGFNLTQARSESEPTEDPEEEQNADKPAIQKGVGLYFVKTPILSDPDSEVVTIYNIVSYFYNRYQLSLSMPGISESKRLQIMDEMDKEISELGMSPIIIRNALKNVDDLGRQFAKSSGNRIIGETNRQRLPLGQQPSRDSKVDCLVAAILSRLSEVGITELPIGLIQNLAFDLIRDRSLLGNSDADRLREVISQRMKKSGFSIEMTEIDQLEQLVIRPAVKEFKSELTPIENFYTADGLPVMSGKLREQVISFIKSSKFGDEVELTFMKEKPFFMTWVGEAESETGKTYPVLLRSGGTSLQLPEEEGMKITVRGRLLPSFHIEAENEAETMARGGKRLASHLRPKRRIFTLLHVTS